MRLLITILFCAICTLGPHTVRAVVSSDSVITNVPIMRLSVANIISQINLERHDNNLVSFKRNESLMKAAQLKVHDIASRGVLEHTKSSPGVLWWPLAASRYVYESAGENLAEGIEDSRELVASWMESPYHRANILKAEYVDIGVAIEKGIYDGEEVSFVVLYMAKPKSTVVRLHDSTSAVVQKADILRKLIATLILYLNQLVAQQS